MFIMPEGIEDMEKLHNKKKKNNPIENENFFHFLILLSPWFKKVTSKC